MSDEQQLRLAEHLDEVRQAVSDKPTTGLATTRELLQEIATRMETTRFNRVVIDIDGAPVDIPRQVALVCKDAIAYAPAPILNYRAVDERVGLRECGETEQLTDSGIEWCVLHNAQRVNNWCVAALDQGDTDQVVQPQRPDSDCKFTALFFRAPQEQNQ